MTSTQLFTKISSLPPSMLREVDDFIDFLLSKKSGQSKNGFSNYKKKILKVSTWSDSDIDQMIHNQQKFDEWRVQEW